MKNRNGFYRQQTEHRLLTDAEEQYVKQMKAVMDVLDKIFNAKVSRTKTGVVLMVHNDGEGPIFMSNGANRDDIVMLMKEMIARFEGMPEMLGRSFN